MNESREVIFAAWIYNIHRFYEKGAEKLIEKSKDILKTFMDVSYLLGIIRKEEAYQEETQFVEEAYRLSLCESEEKDKKAEKKNLTSVFSRITIREQEKPAKKYYPLSAETVEASFPIDKPDDKNLKKLAEQFEQELLNLNRHHPSSWEDFIVIFDELTKKYLWCITASDYEGEDVSLYNQSRIAAAIAACICHCKKETEKCYKLVAGDFSGIQKYVFSVANVSESGVAKRLRTRSFYVDITVSVIAQAIIKQFCLTQNHILMLTGGKFYLLLPNLPDSDQRLENMEKEIGDNFYMMFKGQVAVHLAWLSMGKEGLENYSHSVTEINRQLGEKKSRAFQQTLIKDGKWDEEKFILAHNLKEKKICTSCNSELTAKENRCCENCRIQTEIGGKLPKTKYIAYYREKTEGAYPIYGNYCIGLWKTFKRDHAFLIEQINGKDEKEAVQGFPVKRRFMANYIPADETGEVTTFDKIAESAKGKCKLAVLKADVDNLGYIFADGLRTKEQHFGTISRVNTMSRLLETFFSGYINELISQNSEFQNVYSVFSGGDDLFLIGPWNIMPKLAVEIAEKFHQFAAENPALTISATVSLFHPKEHIANLAEISEHTLKRVKNTSIKEVYPEKEGRNGVSFMQEIYSWEDLNTQLKIGDLLSKLLKEKQIDASILRRISNYSRMYKKFLIDKDVMALMFEPLFHYDRQRNYDRMEREKRKSKELNWFLNEYIRDLSENAADLRIIKKNLYFAEATVTYAMNLTKEDRN